MPNFSLNACATGSRSFSAPTIGVPQAGELLGSALADVAAQQNVGVLIRIVAAVGLGQLADGLGVHRVGVVGDAEAGDAAGTTASPVKPNEWKNGSTPMMQSFAVQLEHLRDRVDVRRGCCGG